MRYFIQLAYNGTAYYGWQRQPAARSVQQSLEESFSTILGQAIEITGCGRTDTGVHATFYIAHFDFEGHFPEGFLRRINKFLPADVVIYDIYPVKADAHARFDAYYRAYAYHLSLVKDPFQQHTAYFYPFADKLRPELMQEAAALVAQYELFLPFCKTGSDAQTMRCQIHRSEWVFGEREMVYHIAANRFLRGMVRLVVGMCLSVGNGQLSLDEVRYALDEQKPLPKSLSVSPAGLFLCEVRYPETLAQGYAGPPG